LREGEIVVARGWGLPGGLERRNGGGKEKGRKTC